MLIEIFSDVVCPWCYIGKRRLDSVLPGLPFAVTVRWRPYQLHPNLPAEGLDRAAYLQQRYGPEADQARIPERIRSEAETVGLSFDFGRIGRMPNTLDAHRLLTWAEHSEDGDPERQHILAERLFRAYFLEGVDVGSREALVRCAADVGFAREAALAGLSSGSVNAAVQSELERGRELGVAGVPCFFLAERFTLPGAQTPEAMEHFIRRAGELCAAD